MRALLLLLFPAASGVLSAADFKSDIQPIFKSKCYACHSEQAKKAKAGYVFDNLQKLAGDIGPKGQIVPGDPGRSHLLELVSRTDDDRMPPPGRDGLTPKEIKLLREWIEQGATLGKADAEKPPSGSGLPPRPPAAPVHDWKNTEGKVIKAAFVRLSGDAVVLRTADGKMYKVPLAKLDAASNEQAKKAAESSATP